MAIASLIGMGMQILGSTGVFDSSHTQTQANYSNFGNFAEAGKVPGVASGQTRTTEDVEVKSTGISDALTMVGGMLPSVAGAFSSLDSSLRAGGKKPPGGRIRTGKKEAREREKVRKNHKPQFETFQDFQDSGMSIADYMFPE